MLTPRARFSLSCGSDLTLFWGLTAADTADAIQLRSQVGSSWEARSDPTESHTGEDRIAEDDTGEDHTGEDRIGEVLLDHLGLSVWFSELV